MLKITCNCLKVKKNTKQSKAIHTHIHTKLKEESYATGNSHQSDSINPLNLALIPLWITLFILNHPHTVSPIQKGVMGDFDIMLKSKYSKYSLKVLNMSCNFKQKV